jgi:hypothetical protein
VLVPLEFQHRHVLPAVINDDVLYVSLSRVRVRLVRLGFLLVPDQQFFRGYLHLTVSIDDLVVQLSEWRLWLWVV